MALQKEKNNVNKQLTTPNIHREATVCVGLCESVATFPFK
jgi:hypothetical protein